MSNMDSEKLNAALSSFETLQMKWAEIRAEDLKQIEALKAEVERQRAALARNDETLAAAIKRGGEESERLSMRVHDLEAEVERLKSGLRSIGAHACQKLPEPCGKDGYRCVTCHARFIFGRPR